MKCKPQIYLFVAPVIVILGLILIGAGKQGALDNPDYNNPHLQQTRIARPEIVPGVVVVKIRSAAVAQSLAKATTVTGLSSLDVKLQQIGATGVQKMFRHKPIPAHSEIGRASCRERV